jgi:hypothetical protein
MPVPSPTEVAPWYLRNITQALGLNESTGEVFVRTDATITGGVTVDNVTIGALGNIDISGTSMPVTGTVDIGNFPATQAVSGTVNIGTIPEVEVKNDSGNPLAVSGTVTANQGTSPWVVSGTVTANLPANTNVNVNGFNGGLVDAFGRLRVSNPVTLFDTQARYYDHEQFSTSTSGTATVAYQAESSTFTLSIGSASGDSILRETTRVFPYQPGKSLLIDQTFCMATPKANLRQRVGYFGQDNGIFFEVDGTTLYMVIRSKSSGVVVEDRIAQANWNTNSMSNTVGVNPSGITLNPALDQIWFCDVEWLGVGSVRTGFIVNGQYITCHIFHHANTPSTLTADNTTTYMTTATLPLRLEITNTGATASVSMMRQVCASVISEGGFQLSGSGNPRAASHVIGSPVTLPNDLSFKPVIAIRLKSTMLDAVVIPINYSLVPAQQSIFQFRIYKYAITSGGTWVDSAVDSAVQYNLGPTALVSGDIVEQSFINSTNQSSSAPTQEVFNFTYQLERDPFTSTPYEYVIMMATTGNGQTVYASVEWQEIT